MTKFDTAIVLSNSKIAKELVSLIPHGEMKNIWNKLKKEFASRELIAYENTKKLLLGEISTKVSQREMAIKEALRIVNTQKIRMDNLLSQALAA